MKSYIFFLSFCKRNIKKKYEKKNEKKSGIIGRNIGCSLYKLNYFYLIL